MVGDGKGERREGAPETAWLSLYRAPKYLNLAVVERATDGRRRRAKQRKVIAKTARKYR